MVRKVRDVYVENRLLRRWADALLVMVVLSLCMDVFALICSGEGVMSWPDVVSTVSETVFLLSVSGQVLVFNGCPGVCRGVRVWCWVTAVLLWFSVLLVRVPMLIGEDNLVGVGLPISYVSMFLSTLWLVSLFALFSVVSVKHAVRGFRSSLLGMLGMLSFALIGAALLLLTVLVEDVGAWIYGAWMLVAVLSVVPFWCLRRLVYKFSKEETDNVI